MRVLVTGGTGTIGSALVERLLIETNDDIIVLSRNDSRQHMLRQKFRHYGNRLKMRLGDIRDPATCHLAVMGCDVVYNCAALKHVWAAEQDPTYAMEINVGGTANILYAFNADCSAHGRAGTFVQLSTDKAAAPTCVMGMSKYTAERVIKAADTQWVNSVIVRFGNVWESNGSVIPTWKQAMRDERRIVVTDWDVTRYFIPVGRAADALITAYDECQPVVRTFIPAMKAKTLRDVWAYTVKSYIDEYGQCDPDYPVDYIGLQPGEKMHESCLTPDEAAHLDELVPEIGLYFCDDPAVAAVHPTKKVDLTEPMLKRYLSSEYAT